MPRATISDKPTRFELKTVPGGFVEIKELPFGGSLSRRDKALRYLQKADPKNAKNIETQVEVMNEATRYFDFANCVVGHNLEDDFGNPLDFGNPMTLQILPNRVGQEIESYIDKVNGNDFDPDTFTSPSDASSMETSNDSHEVEA